MEAFMRMAARNASAGPDFHAVIDVTEGSPSYGRLVNTATVGPLVEIGLGRMRAEELVELLGAAKPSTAGPAAPRA